MFRFLSTLLLTLVFLMTAYPVPLTRNSIYDAFLYEELGKYSQFEFFFSPLDRVATVEAVF